MQGRHLLRPLQGEPRKHAAGSGVAELPLGGLQHAGAVLVRALVLADLLGAVVVALGESTACTSDAVSS